MTSSALHQLLVCLPAIGTHTSCCATCCAVAYSTCSQRKCGLLPKMTQCTAAKLLLVHKGAGSHDHRCMSTAKCAYLPRCMLQTRRSCGWSRMRWTRSPLPAARSSRYWCCSPRRSPAGSLPPRPASSWGGGCMVGTSLTHSSMFESSSTCDAGCQVLLYALRGQYPFCSTCRAPQEAAVVLERDAPACALQAASWVCRCRTPSQRRRAPALQRRPATAPRR